MRYRSISVFCLGGWSPRLPTGFLVSRGTLVPSVLIRLSPTGLSPPAALLPRRFGWASLSYDGPQPPRSFLHGFGLLPRSLAATWGISFDYFSSGYLDVSVRPVPSHTQWHGWQGINPAGLLHSEICGSKIICISPQLIAACRVLHRQISPRHPPYALTILTYLVSSHLDLLGFSLLRFSFGTSEKHFL